MEGLGIPILCCQAWSGEEYQCCCAFFRRCEELKLCGGVIWSNWRHGYSSFTLTRWQKWYSCLQLLWTIIPHQFEVITLSEKCTAALIFFFSPCSMFCLDYFNCACLLSFLPLSLCISFFQLYLKTWFWTRVLVLFLSPLIPHPEYHLSWTLLILTLIIFSTLNVMRWFQERKLSPVHLSI